MNSEKLTDIQTANDLNVRECNAIFEYLKHGNKTRAYRDIFGDYDQVSRKAWALFDRAAVKKAIAQIKAEMAQEAITSAQEITYELSALAFSNLMDMLDHDQESGMYLLKPASQLSQAQKAAISEIKTTTDKYGNVITTIKLHDKLQAIDKLCKHLGYYEAHNEQKKSINAVQIYLPDNNRDNTKTIHIQPVKLPKGNNPME